MNNIVPNSFIALSDFHSTDWVVEKVENYYLNEYDKIFILGDAIDRGPDGKGEQSFNILNRIYELSNKHPGRIIYIPGNHDDFLYKASKGDLDSINNLQYNHGGATYATYVNRHKDNNSGLSGERIEKLVEWIGKQPIQAIHHYNGQKYVFAHALFNQMLYDDYPNLCLEDVYFSKSYGLKKDVEKMLWFRKGKDDYNKETLPLDNSIMVIGHTPPSGRSSTDLDLKNKYGNTIKVFCVDGGATFGSNTLKFDGGVKEIKTYKQSHNDTSPKAKDSTGNIRFFDAQEKYKKLISKSTNENTKEILNTFIINLLKAENIDEKNKYDILYNFICSGNISIIPNIPSLKALAEEIASNAYSIYMDIMLDAAQKNNNTPFFKNDFIKEYINEVAFNYILNCLKERYGTLQNAANQINGVFKFNSYEYITRTGGARDIAKIIGIDKMKQVISNNNCNSITEYITAAFEKDPIK